MRVTKSMIDTVVKQVLADVPTVDYERQMQDHIDRVLRYLIPEDIRRYITDGGDMRRLYDEGFWIPYTHSDGRSSNHYVRVKGLLHSDLPNTQEAKTALYEERGLPTYISNMYSRIYDQRTLLANIENKLRQSLSAYTTVKRMREDFPELARYLPEDTPPQTRNLPMVLDKSVLKELKNAGVKLKAEEEQES